MEHPKETFPAEFLDRSEQRRAAPMLWITPTTPKEWRLHAVAFGPSFDHADARKQLAAQEAEINAAAEPMRKLAAEGLGQPYEPLRPQPITGLRVIDVTTLLCAVDARLKECLRGRPGPAE